MIRDDRTAHSVRVNRVLMQHQEVTVNISTGKVIWVFANANDMWECVHGVSPYVGPHIRATKEGRYRMWKSDVPERWHYVVPEQRILHFSSGIVVGAWGVWSE